MRKLASNKFTCDICQAEYPTKEGAFSCKRKYGIPLPKYSPGQSAICSVPDQKNPEVIHQVKVVIKKIGFLKPNNRRNMDPHTIIYVIAIDLVNGEPFPGAQMATILETEIKEVIKQS